MTFTPLLHITLPEDDGEERHFAPIILALEAMSSINTWHIKRSLKRAEKGEGKPIPPLYASGVYYEEDKPGREDWRDCYAVLKRGKGDCLPLKTMVHCNRDGSPRPVPLDSLQVGDRIAANGDWTLVTEVAATGPKEVFSFVLSNRAVLQCTAEHIVFRRDAQRIVEVRAGDLRPGDRLLTPSDWVRDGHAGYSRIGDDMTVSVIDRVTAGVMECGDITTEAGKFWLVDSDVIVHNCDNLVAWRVGELRAAGIHAEPVVKWKRISKAQMIQLGYPADKIPPEGINMVHCSVRHPDGRIEDVSKNLGMGGSYTSKV